MLGRGWGVGPTGECVWRGRGIFIGKGLWGAGGNLGRGHRGPGEGKRESGVVLVEQGRDLGGALEGLGGLREGPGAFCRGWWGCQGDPGQ